MKVCAYQGFVCMFGFRWIDYSQYKWSIYSVEILGQDSLLPWKINPLCQVHLASLVAQRVKCLPTMQETGVQSLGREDSLEKEMATHSSIVAWRIPWMEEPDGLQSMGSQIVGHDWTTSLHTFLQNDQIILCHYKVCLVEWTGKEASRNYILWPHTYFSHQLFFPDGLHRWALTSPLSTVSEESPGLCMKGCLSPVP